MRLDETNVMALDEIKPYWRNPRSTTDGAVESVATSIHKYGYNQPIVVDSDHVIIIGHTRYAALRQLGYTSSPVKVETTLSDAKVRELRIIDNRTSDYTTWDYETLMNEIEDLDRETMSLYFPEVLVSTEGFTEPGQDWTVDSEGPTTMEFICPSCFHEWSQEVEREQVMNGRISQEEKA